MLIMAEKLVAYERPDIDVLKGIRVFFDLVLPKKVDLPADMDWRAKKIKEFIDSHPVQGGRNVDDVCKELGLSMSGRQARRLFRVSTGVGIRDYARNRRLAVAVEQLEATDVPVKAIAADLGYHSTREFRRRFKEFFGLSPMEFRKAWWSRDLGAGLERSP
jgi:transcriptional regulator GlxA family with amidase domain